MNEKTGNKDSCIGRTKIINKDRVARFTFYKDNLKGSWDQDYKANLFPFCNIILKFQDMHINQQYKVVIIISLSSITPLYSVLHKQYRSLNQVS